MIADILGGKTVGTRSANDDLQYVEDLGLIVRRPQVRIANRIYQEVIMIVIPPGSMAVCQGGSKPPCD